MASEVERSGVDLGGPHEPSYYEIALTNRQVVVAFVILLVCLVAAFLSGMWIGRESAARLGQQMARLTPTGTSADKTDAQPQSLQEFKFFNETKHKPSAAPAKAAAEPATAPAAASAPREETPRQAPPWAKAGVKPPLPPAASPAAEVPAAPAPTPAPAATASTAAGTSTAPATAAGDLVIQVFSSADKAQAVKVRDRLVKVGQQAFLSPIEKNGQTMYRVRIGPFTSRESAQKIADLVRKEQKLDTWITPR
jgi:cell division septation protein DedD